ncbi:MAG TPA: calcium/sodium antiporter [Acidobacteriota bacterium]
MSLNAVIVFIGGLALLLVGAELLVRGASRLAVALGISPLVIGLTVVAWGTGSPELAVAVNAAMEGRADLAVGNVVGSNIANILLILGLAAVIAPLKVSARVVILDVPVMIGVSFLTLLLAFDGVLGTFDGLLLLAALVVYTVWTVWESRRVRRALRRQLERELAGKQAGEPTPRWQLLAYALEAAWIVVGLSLLVKGSDWLVEGASTLAISFGFSELVIGLTIVAVGTSLPELATSAVAAARGERDLAVGNAVGSNIFNILAVLGITAVIGVDGIAIAPVALSFDIPIMIAVAIACIPVFFSGHAIDRWQGALFVALFAAYMTYLVLDGIGHATVRGFTTIMTMVILPLVALTLALVLYRAWKNPDVT